MKNKNSIYGLLISLLFLFSACQKLDVENFNDTDTETALSKAEDLLLAGGGVINTWFQETQEFDGLSLTLFMASDHGTCSWGMAGSRDISTEPREAWNNEANYSYARASLSYYLAMNEVLSTSNIVASQLVNNDILSPEETTMLLTIARFGQGLGMGYLGFVYDKGFVVDESMNLEADEVPIATYMEMRDAALFKLDEVIALCDANTFTLPSAWIPGMTWTNVELGKLANSMAARVLVYTSRNATENTATDWTRVKSYAEKGVDFDFEPLADDVTWYSLYHTYGVYGGWARVDMRVVNMLDPNMPDYFPASGSFDDLPNNGFATSDDARLVSDFQYLSTCNFRPERGVYHFSSYRYTRHDQYLATWTEPMPEMRKAENDLLLAEAKLMTGDVAGAITILNAGTRISRGGLVPIASASSSAEVLDAIVYERTIELYLTGFGIPFFDMRRADQLQLGTPLHFPIPRAQLDIMLMEDYTFGGVLNADGIGTSNGGWNSK